MFRPSAPFDRIIHGCGLRRSARWAPCALAVLLVGASAAEVMGAALPVDEAEAQASTLRMETGTIESLDLRQKSFRLRVGSGASSRTMRVRALLSTPLTAAGRDITWDNLREGQSVAVRWHDTTGRRARSNQRIYPSEIELLTQEVTGRIEGVNAGSEIVRVRVGELEEVEESRGGRTVRRMALKESDEEVRARRQTARLHALPGLQVLRDGQPISLREVRDGDFFRARVVEAGAKRLLLDVEVNPKLSGAAADSEAPVTSTAQASGADAKTP